MWDFGLMDEKLEFELSRDDNVLALRSGMNDTPYNMDRLKSQRSRAVLPYLPSI